MARGRTVRMFLADGTAEGLRILEMSNWTGVALVCGRADWARVASREEFAKPGVYVLAGDRDGEPAIYIGQAETLRSRIGTHDAQKDFWEHVVVFTSKDANLTVSHARWLESRLVALAQRAKRARLENGNAPAAPALPEAERADMETFLDTMLVLYPLVGVTAFEVVAAPPSPVQRPTPPPVGVFPTGGSSPDAPPPAAVERPAGEFPPLFLRARDADAEGRYRSEGFLVLSGALARRDETTSCPETLRQYRRRLVESGVLVAHGTHLRLTQDTLFGSPSTAAAVLLGASANGRIEWKTADGRTLKDLQAARANA